MSTIRKIYSSFQFEIKVLKKQFIFLTIITSIIAINANVYYQQESQSMLDHHVLQLERQAGLLLSQDNLNKTKDDPMLTQIESDLATILSKEYTLFKKHDDDKELLDLIKNKIVLLKQYQNLYPYEFLSKLSIDINDEIILSETLELIENGNLSYEFNKSAVFPLVSISSLKKSLIFVPLISLLIIVIVQRESKPLFIYKNNSQTKISTQILASLILLLSVLITFLLAQVVYHVALNPSIFSTSSLYLKYPLYIDGEFIAAQYVLSYYVFQFVLISSMSVLVINLLMAIYSYKNKKN